MITHRNTRLRGKAHCLDVPAASLEEHVQMQLYRCTNNNSAQIWDESGPDPIIR